jgi:hypothetical protein
MVHHVLHQDMAAKKGAEPAAGIGQKRHEGEF